MSALKMMLHEAERSRAEAESAVPTVNVEEISKRMSEELASRDAEVGALRMQSLRQQEATTAELRHLRGDLAQAQEAVAREIDLRRSDQAEARSLAAEIERLAAGDPEIASSDDLEITLSVLHDQLQSSTDLGAIAAAAEAVMVGWAKLVATRTESARRELGQLSSDAASRAKDTAQRCPGSAPRARGGPASGSPTPTPARSRCRRARWRASRN